MADRMDEEQRQRGSQQERLLTTTEELEKARAQIRGLEEELTRAKEYAAIMTNMDQNTSIDTEPVVSVDIQNAPPEAEAAPAVNTVSVIGTEQAQEIVTLRDELVAQEVLREKEREQKRTAEEKQTMIDLRRSARNCCRTRTSFGEWQKQRSNG